MSYEIRGRFESGRPDHESSAKSSNYSNSASAYLAQIGPKVALVTLAALSACQSLPPGFASDERACITVAWDRCAGIDSCHQRERKECLREHGWTRDGGRWHRVETERDRAREIEEARR